MLNSAELAELSMKEVSEFCQCFKIYKQNKFHAQLSWAWKRFYNLGARSSCAWTEYYLGLCSAFIHSVVSIDSVCWQWRPWSDCMDAQADLGLNCSHMPEDTFSHGLAHIAPLLLWLDSEDRDQTAWTHKLICTFAVQICLKSPFCLRHLICKCILSK